MEIIWHDARQMKTDTGELTASKEREQHAPLRWLFMIYLVRSWILKAFLNPMENGYDKNDYYHAI